MRLKTIVKGLVFLTLGTALYISAVFLIEHDVSESDYLKMIFLITLATGSLIAMAIFLWLEQGIVEIEQMDVLEVNSADVEAETTRAVLAALKEWGDGRDKENHPKVF